MTSPFEIRLPRRIVFGRGIAPGAIAGAAPGWKRPFVVHGRTADRAGWLIDLLEQAGCAVTTCAAATEPDTAMLEGALAGARAAGADCVIGLGGGAAMDLAKAVAGLAPSRGPLTDYLEVVGAGRPPENEPLPFVAIPTTSGTGAEATRNAVVGVPSHGRKVSIRDPRMLAELAIVDPALTDLCPWPVTLASGLDAVTQLIEPYLSIKANPFTDALVRAHLDPALSALKVLAEHEDPGARDRMALASHAGGICLANAGLGVVHGIAGVIGGMSDQPHGRICAGLLAASLAVNRAAIARRGLDTGRIDEIDTLLIRHFGGSAKGSGFERLGAWIHAMGISGPVVPAGGDPATIAAMSAQSSSFKANPVALDEAEILSILGHGPD